MRIMKIMPWWMLWFLFRKLVFFTRSNRHLLKTQQRNAWKFPPPLSTQSRFMFRLTWFVVEEFNTSRKWEFNIYSLVYITLILTILDLRLSDRQVVNRNNIKKIWRRCGRLLQSLFSKAYNQRFIGPSLQLSSLGFMYVTGKKAVKTLCQLAPMLPHRPYASLLSLRWLISIRSLSCRIWSAGTVALLKNGHSVACAKPKLKSYWSVHISQRNRPLLSDYWENLVLFKRDNNMRCRYSNNGIISIIMQQMLHAAACWYAASFLNRYGRMMDCCFLDEKIR